ncbi:GNAT family acetyltransferase [Pseudohyphozyma bogoriensis]|nr:GNAT family acetyltransferase [Pseudohyphozyma bogoriensis]
MPTNSWKPPAPTPVLPYHLDTPADEYDLNFFWPVPDKMETPGGVRLEPVIPSLHARELFSLLPHTSPVFTHFTFHGPQSLDSLLTFPLEKFRSLPTNTLFLIRDLSYPSAPIAGLIGVLKSDYENRMTEIGPVMVLEKYQRTHVASHAVGLVLRWAFDELGLRRVQWCANSLNAGSVAIAKRFGFDEEGLLRWERVLPVGKGGEEVPEWAREREEEEGREEKKGRHGVIMGMGWDKWREEGKGNVQKMLEREVRRKDD